MPPAATTTTALCCSTAAVAVVSPVGKSPIFVPFSRPLWISNEMEKVFVELKVSIMGKGGKPRQMQPYP